VFWLPLDRLITLARVGRPATQAGECRASHARRRRGGTSSLADALSDAADYGYCASHSRFFWGFRLHALFALDGTTPERSR
jgi:hypothetical protein